MTAVVVQAVAGSNPVAHPSKPSFRSTIDPFHEQEGKMRRNTLRLLAMLLLATATLVIGAATAHATVTAVIGPKAKLIGTGEAVSDTVTVSCDAGLQVIDATFSVQQGATDGTAHFTEMVVCDGKAHRYKITVPVRSGSGLFHPGEAFAVAVVYAQDQNGGPQRAEVGATITVR
jgi:hypothetical protein